ncbi:GNAT family N-acetyltransferase [uncultured Methanomethylovorans sp.]|uniref:GNAT family N-acetyltransferase n=1 Tax=uncultured Methanomethylovorans sp. TaxID=183759 RepID=UPI002AA62F80|nr:GNAT family N-acetyltransferase [uncultured Methanomethylovorans sp.]
MKNEDRVMNIRLQYDCSNVDWNYVSSILESVGIAYFESKVHKIAFENSCVVVLLYEDDKLIGFGRAISDNAYQAAIYDVAVSQPYQGRGLGKLIVNSILKSIPQCNFILYASPGKEGFYETLNFKKMKTGMALFRDADGMQIEGFTK